MLTSQRRETIVDMVQKDSAVTVARLIAMFHVSAETIRKDLLCLEKAGKLIRVHGGAVSRNHAQPFHNFTSRIEEHRTEKRELSELAVRLVREGDVIGIDAGTTAIEFAGALAQSFHSLTIFTYSMDVFERVRGCRDFRVLLCGGEYSREERVFCGVFSSRMLDQVHMKKAFLFPSAISLKNGVCDYCLEMLELQQKLAQNSDQLVVLADSSKYEKNALFKVCETVPKHIYISDSALSENIKELYANSQCRIITRKDEIDESIIGFE